MPKDAKMDASACVTFLNDWDLLLGSTDPYTGCEEGDEDGELNEDERRKEETVVKEGLEEFERTNYLGDLLGDHRDLCSHLEAAYPQCCRKQQQQQQQKTQHFDGFAADYLEGEFFMDIHPPLGKMLYVGVAYMLGFDGNFEFVPGKLYTRNVLYIGMRMFAVPCGVGLIPVSCLTIKKSGHSTLSCHDLRNFGYLW
ncbi:hypothetical protein BGZ79_003944 [Entomortierella chlamydospora]|nr:hypothetical protein BGZ79_003944 [Entomortierella chlamydospora]